MSNTVPFSLKGPAEVRTHCEVDTIALLSARTIANLAESEPITAPHVAEALQHRAQVEVS